VHWHYTITQDGNVIQDQEGYMPDPFGYLVQQVENTTQFTGTDPAKISCTVQQSLQYGELKCSFTITISCPQNQAAMDFAAQHAFIQATHYVNNGMRFLAPGLQPLQVPAANLPFPQG
jgi:hypothetical protein